MNKILFVSDGLVHPPLLARRALYKTLAEVSGYEFQRVRSMEKLPGNLRDFSALVIYVHHKSISNAALAALDGFVSNGGGLLGVHSATASFKQQMHFFEILGGRFSRHGTVEEFEVKPVTKSEIFSGIGAFSVKDELYIHDLQPGIKVHFTADHHGQDTPAVWTYQYGKGRVCYAVPGHRTASLKDKNYQKVLQQGLLWVCEG